MTKLPDDLQALTFQELDRLYNIVANTTGGDLQPIVAELERREDRRNGLYLRPPHRSAGD